MATSKEIERARQQSRNRATRLREPQCSKCRITDEDHKLKYGVGLHVHHLDGEALNNEPDNLLTLCVSCHRRLHEEMKGRKHMGDKCSVDGCDRPILYNGFCAMHEKRFRKYGDPLLTKIKTGMRECTLVKVDATFTVDTNAYKNGRR